MKSISLGDIPNAEDIAVSEARRAAIVRSFLDIIDSPPFAVFNPKSSREFLIILSPVFEIGNTSKARMTLEHKIEPVDINSQVKGLIVHKTSLSSIDTTVKLRSLPPSESGAPARKGGEQWLLLCPDCPVKNDAAARSARHSGVSYAVELIPSAVVAEELSALNRDIGKLGLRVSAFNQTRAIRVRVYSQ